MDDSVIGALFDAATKVRAHAYAPYSRFKVGAALICEDGRIFAGCNVENAAFPSGTCAEQGAIAAMIAGGARQIAAIAIVGDAPTPVAPCGACRQRISEFAHSGTRIIAGNHAGLRQIFTMDELLPQAFSLRKDTMA